MAFETVPTFLPGDVPDAADWATYKAAIEELRPITAIKPSNTDRTSTTTPTADPDLAVAMVASTTYDYEAWLYISANGDTPDFKAQLSFPTGCTLHKGTIGPTTTVAGNTGDGVFGLLGLGDTSSPSSDAIFGATSSGITALAKGRIEVGSTAGDLTVLWSQNTTSANLTRLHLGSTLTIRKV